MRVLHFIHGLNVGGAETFLINLLDLHLENVEFYFAIQNPEITNRKLEKKIASLGNDRIVVIPAFPKHFFSQFSALKEIISSNKIDRMHIHMNAFLNPLPVYACMKLGIKAIIHSHNSSNNRGGMIGRMLHNTNKRLFSTSDQIKVACSKLAGKWMFGNDKFTVVNNAISLEPFKYSWANRNSLRDDYGIGDDEYVIGFVGRLVPAKNLDFALTLIKEMMPAHNVRLAIVGDGPLMMLLRAKAKEYGIDQHVVFAGQQQDVARYYNMFDVFIMPSLFEGLAFTAIEAQANGLRIIASDTVTHEIQVSDLVEFLSLDAPKESWVKAIMKHADKSEDRIALGNRLRGSKFDSTELKSVITELYR